MGDTMATLRSCPLQEDCLGGDCNNCDSMRSRNYPPEAPRQPEVVSVLQIADSLIHGERAAQHGPVEETFGRTAILFDNMLTAEERKKIGCANTPRTAVAKMMIALKLARMSYSATHRDNRIDAAGYIGLLDELEAL